MIGRLLFYDQKIPMIDKIQMAAEFHLKKFGRSPEVVLVNREELSQVESDERKEIAALPYLVRGMIYVMKKHYWAGRDDPESLKQEEDKPL